MDRGEITTLGGPIVSVSQMNGVRSYMRICHVMKLQTIAGTDVGSDLLRDYFYLLDP